jgi:hypothetical protein
MPAARGRVTPPMYAHIAICAKPEEFALLRVSTGQQVLQIITAAEARGQQRLSEMNQQVLGNLDNIITTLEADPGPEEREAADAR